MKTLMAACVMVLSLTPLPAAAIGRIADVTVYDRSEGRKLPIYWHEGRAYVVGKPGNEYQLKLRNRQDEELLAVMSVDGVNVISGETAATGQGGYVLAPWREFGVNGWRKDLTRTAAFYFTPLPDSYAARTGRAGNVGAIGVALFRKKPPEPAPFARAPAPMAPLGTGHGRSETSHARYVGFERASSAPAETIVIYYDSERNLRAQGILPSPRHRPAPDPFPGFVADPPA